MVSVLGHVDHGKTTLLDSIRGTSVAAREAGLITQAIGATEVPLEAVVERCGALAEGKKFSVPGLLFIDTPGHRAFTTLRSRGGALSDIAILVVDLREGQKPQTVESLNILRRSKTPFVVAATKIDALDGWIACDHTDFRTALGKQPERVQERLDERIYRIAGFLSQNGLSGDRYDRITDFTRNIAIVPVSARADVGISDLLLLLVGLAQAFLGARLDVEAGPAKGTVLEVKEEKGFGTTLSAIVYAGTLRRGDELVIGSPSGPQLSKVRALLLPRPMDEIRDPQERFQNVPSVTAAAGVKIALQDPGPVVAGAPLRGIRAGGREEALQEIREEMAITVKIEPAGLAVKADAVGSLEALSFELGQAGIPIGSAGIGDIARRDVTNAATLADPLHRVILGFNIRVLPDAQEVVAAESAVAVFTSEILYELVDRYREWSKTKKAEMEAERRKEHAHPGQIRLLPDHIFRVSKPAIVGVRVLAGRIRPGESLIHPDGREVGRIRSIRSGEDVKREAMVGDEVAIAIEGPTVGRQVNPGDILLVDLTETEYRMLQTVDLTPEEREVADRVAGAHRRERTFWGL